MGWKHYLAAAGLAIVAVMIANRISALSTIMNNGRDFSTAGTA